MKLGLKLMASIFSDRVNAKREFVYNIINKLNGILLIVTRIDFKFPDSGSIIYGCILKTSDSVALKVSQRDKFDINLNMMTRNFFGIASSIN